MPAKPDAPAPPRGLDAWLAVVRNYQKCQRVLAQALADLGLSVAQYDALIAISRAEGLTQQELAERLLVVKSNVTGLLQRLEAQGLVRRRADPVDARQKRLSLTAAGRRLATRAFDVQARVVEAMMQTMDDRELEKQRELAGRIGHTLDELLSSRD